ncbi:pectinesterase family protein [Maribellus sediminis]|uniref:pectinesterase family protein n=1 Tax=Maribellus sediminis TaxID=2696285 RepID=UPI0014316D0A|nr:pectinesterase family protein [Maribellus sediminis]
MKRILQLAILTLVYFAFLPLVSAQNPQDADMVVAADGSGDFTTLQAAIDATPSNSNKRTVIYIKRGVYDTEKLIVPADKINLTLIGESREETIISYHIYDCGTAALGKCPEEDATKWTGDNIRTSATLTIMADGFRAENMTIRNTAGPVGQAQAITVRSDKCIFINVDFYGYQDTMYFWSDKKRSYFEGCLVVGRTDYIYGSGTVFFQSCEIRTWGGGYITAPSTYKDQPYGFVFNECDITYGTNSPRGGDDGQMIRMGRPWHEYPKVAWLRCNITEMMNPLGWGDKWNMDYADTSEDLHLYEYQNTGPGADMSGRANWAGIKELTTEEAADYTVQKVMAGNDGWDPTAEAPLVTTYKWVGAASGTGWKEAENWNPAGIPATGELATVDSAFTLTSGNDTFQADLALKNYAQLEVAGNSVATYISAANAVLSASGDAVLDGKIATKDSLHFDVDGTLTVNADLQGIHALTKTGEGTVILAADNSNFSGDVLVKEGTLEATNSGSLGKSSVTVGVGGTLSVSNDNAFYAKAQLSVVTGSKLILNSTVTLSQFYVNGVMQPVGEYNATFEPVSISGPGKIVIGRPDTLTFHRSGNGNWDEAANFIPALIPQTGETVIVQEEMETTSTVFEADILLQSPGNIRMRGAHKSTGTLYMGDGTNFKYNTGGTGMSLEAPIVIQGDVQMIMESGNTAGSTLGLSGPISGKYSLQALNNGKGTVNNGKLLLSGDNSGFSGTWDLTAYSRKYPGVNGYNTLIEGESENAFGHGTIIAGHENQVIFSHAKVAGDSLRLTLNESATAVLNANVEVKYFLFNGEEMAEGEYDATTHPDLLTGGGKIIVGNGGGGPLEELAAFPGAEGHGRYATGGRGGQVIYVTNLEDNNNPGSLRWAVNQSGPRIILFKVSGTIDLKSKLSIKNDNITIAGQTAPGDGITLRNYSVNVDADNVIIRFMRFRMGDTAQQEDDALGGRFHKNIIVDHCSMSWSTDECVSFYVNENFTLQWSIVSESLRNSVHDKGAHGYGGIWGGKNASFHHNLLAHHDSRNPRLGESAGTTYALTDLVDLRNNVIYNWGGNSCYGGEGMNVNIVNCYYKPGPATSKIERIVSIDKNKTEGTPIYGIWGKFYIDGNVLTESARATNDNWTYGVYNQFHSSNGTVTQEERDAMRISQPHDPGKVTTHTAEMAYERILEYCGASLATDSVDLRIIHDVSTGTATYMDGGNGSKNGIIDTQGAVGGWPVLKSEPAPTDTDDDGMPDDWETANSLNPNDPSDAQLKSVDGVYPNIEVYINSLVSHIVEAQNEGGEWTDAGEIRLDDNGDQQTIKAYIDHSAAKLVISHKEKISDVKIYSITGQLLINREFNERDVRIDVSALKNGLYIISVRDENNRVYSEKIMTF